MFRYTSETLDMKEDYCDYKILLDEAGPICSLNSMRVIYLQKHLISSKNKHIEFVTTHIMILLIQVF